MPTFNASYTVPKPSTTEVADGARAVFQNEETALFSELGLGDGGFKANADRVFMLDNTNRVVSAPVNEHGMTAAAQAGRLYVMDKNYRLRQVRLDASEDDGFTFKVSKPLRLRQLPRLSMDYFIKRFVAILNDFMRDMSKIFNDMKRDMSKIFDNSNNSILKILGGRKKENAQAEREVEAEPLVPEDVLLETQQPTPSELTTAELLAKKTTEQTTPEFERYLSALADRSNGSLVEEALNKKKGEPKDYYEALAQELEGQIARYIRDAAPSEKNPEEREAFMDKQKPVVAFMSYDLRKFVQRKVALQSVEDFYAQGLKADSPMGRKLQDNANHLKNTGVKEYIDGVLAEVKSSQQTKQQSQLSVNPMQQSKIKHDEPQAPSIGGMGGMH